MDVLHLTGTGLTILLLLVAAVIAVRVYRSRSEALKLSLPVLSGSAAARGTRVAINPLQGVSFQESLQPEVFAEATRQNVIGAMLVSYGADTASTGLQIAASHTGSLLVSFKDQNYEMVQSTNGVYKAMTRAANGDFHEIANVDKFGTWLNNVSHASAAVVAVAHLISNADMSRRLGEVQKNTDKLLDYRQIDTLAKIQTTYESLREEIGKVEPRRDAIARYRETFRENRHRLFREAENDIGQMPSMLRFNPALVRKAEQLVKTPQFNKRKRDLSEVMTKLQTASYCFQMETLAASFCGSEQDQQHLLHEAAASWSTLASKVTHLEDEIREHDQCGKQLQETANIIRQNMTRRPHRPQRDGF